MKFQELALQIRECDADTICDLFLGWGALSASIEYPREELPQMRRLTNEGHRNDLLSHRHCNVKVLLEQECDIVDLLQKVTEIHAWEEPPCYSVESIEEQDWVRLSRENLAPLLIGEKLWVVPTWETLPDPDALFLRLDPGTAFGSGRHPTTRLCLEWLVGEVKGGETVLDYGCGSGILAIAALKLGAREAVGIDTDPQVREVSAANAKLNEVTLTLYSPEEAPGVQADVIVANLFANPLMEMAPRISAHVRKQGVIALSGILADQAKEITEVYAQWFEFSPPTTEKGWVLLTGKKR